MDNKQISPSSHLPEPSGINKEGVASVSKNKWYLIGIIIAIISPPSGFVLGIGFLTESSLRKQGKAILAVSLIWGAVFIWIAQKGYLPNYN